MKHYPHHIADFDRATRHLTRIERSVYRDLMDLYYDTEKELPADTSRVCELVLARSNEESTAVERVLNEFFILTENGWFNSRCDFEIQRFKSNNSQRAQAGKASAEARKAKKLQKLQEVAKLNKRSTSVESPLNEKQTTVPQPEPEPINQNQIVICGAQESQSRDLIPVESTAVAIAPAKSKKGTRLSKDWALPKDWGNWALSKGLTRDQVLNEATRFRNHWVSTTKNPTKLDWEATWQNWILKFIDGHADKQTFYERTKQQKQADAEKRFDSLLNADQETLEKWGLK